MDIDIVLSETSEIGAVVIQNRDAILFGEPQSSHGACENSESLLKFSSAGSVTMKMSPLLACPVLTIGGELPSVMNVECVTVLCDLH